MSYKNDLTQEELKIVFSYDPVGGILTKNRTNQPAITNFDSEIPTVSFMYKGKQYKMAAHIIAWVIYYGEYPTIQNEPAVCIFHRDFNQYNLKIDNLRVVTIKVMRSLRTAYKNLLNYCDIKLHSKDKYTYLLRYLHNGRVKYDRYDDISFAQIEAEQKKNNYRRLIIKHGGIPPI